MSRVFLITGTRKGIGKHLAEYYLERGHTVVGCSRRAGTIEHERYVHHALDVSSEPDVVSMVRCAVRDFDRIDVLLNNAGLASMNHLLATPYETVRGLFETNVFGSFLCMRETAKTMIRRETGCIVNFATVATPLHLEGEAIYAATKAAIVHLTQTAAKELGGFGVRVNAVGPTPIDTDLIRTVPKQKIEALIAQQAIRRMAQPDDVANVIDFFIDERSSFVTGQVIYLGGVPG